MKSWIAIAGLLLLSGPAAAQPMGRGHAREACAADINRLCADVQRGGGRIMQCLRDHRADMSDGCRSAMMEARAAHHHNQGLLSPDRDLGVSPGPPRR